MKWRWWLLFDDYVGKFFTIIMLKVIMQCVVVVMISWEKKRIKNKLEMMLMLLMIFQLIDKTCTSPTPTLEQHLMWDDIAILARYLLMLSFNNSLDGQFVTLQY